MPLLSRSYVVAQTTLLLLLVTGLCRVHAERSIGTRSSAASAVTVLRGGSSEEVSAASSSAATSTVDANDGTADDHEFDMMLEKVQTQVGIIAALDQSGGSTPKALQRYGYPEDLYNEGDESMYDAIHNMRCRLMKCNTFTGDKGLGAILFEKTALDRVVEVDSDVDGQQSSYSTPEYLWKVKQVVPFLKVDKGLEELNDDSEGVQLMKPIPNLQDLLIRAKSKGIFGTKMRSVIHAANPVGIEKCVKQQFEIGKQILACGLVPILEPEVNIESDEKHQCEVLLKQCLLNELNQLSPEQKVMIKVSIPTETNFYAECIDHPNCIRLVALSGGYTREEATTLLKNQENMIASFSRALTEGLTHHMPDEEFEAVLGEAISSIYEASK